MKNQPRSTKKSMKNHENRPRTMKNKPGTMKNQPGTNKKHIQRPIMRIVLSTTKVRSLVTHLLFELMFSKHLLRQTIFQNTFLKNMTFILKF